MTRKKLEKLALRLELTLDSIEELAEVPGSIFVQVSPAASYIPASQYHDAMDELQAICDERQHIGADRLVIVPKS